MRQSLLAMHKTPAAQAICDCLVTWGINRTAAWDSNEKTGRSREYDDRNIGQL